MPDIQNDGPPVNLGSIPFEAMLRAKDAWEYALKFRDCGTDGEGKPLDYEHERDAFIAVSVALSTYLGEDDHTLVRVADAEAEQAAIHKKQCDDIGSALKLLAAHKRKRARAIREQQKKSRRTKEKRARRMRASKFVVRVSP